MKCMKTEVYSWRVSTDLKVGLEREARRRNISLAALLDQAARDLLSSGTSVAEDDQEQVRLHAAAADCLGSIAGGNPQRSGNARAAIRQRLQRRRRES